MSATAGTRATLVLPMLLGLARELSDEFAGLALEAVTDAVVAAAAQVRDLGLDAPDAVAEVGRIARVALSATAAAALPVAS